MGGFLFGYDLVIIAGAQIFVRKEFHLNDAQFGFATSSAILGCIAGPFVGAWLCDWIGRKTTLILAGILFAVGAIGTALPHDIITFNIFRIVGGLGVGFASIASPMYIVEVAPARMRGRLGLMYQLAICVGALISVVVAYNLARMLPESVSWRWMFASTLVPVVGFLTCLPFLPQSPRWLASRNRCEEAMKVFARIGGPDYARTELEGIKESLEEERGSFGELLQPGFRRALVVGVLLALFNNWTGWSGIAYYLPTLFQKAGFVAASDAIYQSVYIFAGNIVLTLIAIWMVDRFGRRPLWIVTSAAMACSLTIAGMVFHNNMTGLMIVLVIFLCAAPHCIGLGPLPWLMMSEIYPTRIRARAVALSTTFLWFAGFTGPLAFPKIAAVSEKMIGSIAGLFWMYAVICVFAFIFGIKLLPETKGKTLEDITKSILMRH
ncbi:MAG: hypothetical protein A2Z18_01475 [Armatimonadetes bacterium RBG_16_58_9]|nr:MAG: hypothetical protein A2Z18_01475 [Armatimonadetes bacterium RBG_16_58_9]